ncbi:MULTISPECIES: hypothetical protein [Achromobacter]|jgi:hypothetical protein|uniref:Uncharacterized protein n=2 Tax=Achromobacter aegrifaciens TaxID=1287736 RepID=A0ABU2DC41_ACHAE|nr:MULTISPECIES: hypothetical protein [Achromobacter]MBD9380203.1 hypothetical protein [Achromobacter sp. ACM02]MBD9418578.1 hypothetical protein [Achromobacter sp. ACM04]MBD9428963.1 hypothetical protein [Achromobacter sp. ACM03]MDQ1760304.1 hypothetical protein [Achromobacter aegrifaciens]MDR7945684.1 hypothetical protein [Achromobacter aegrifaciens]
MSMEDSPKQEWQAWVALACKTHGLAVPVETQAAVARTLLRLAAVQAEIDGCGDDDA